MNDLEQRLMHALAETRQPADEDFVTRVSERVHALESVRMLGLVILTIAALCLGGALYFGLSWSWNAARGASLTLATVLPTATPLFTMAFVALATLLLLPPSRTPE